MNYYTRYRSIPYMGGITILVIMFLAMLLRCTPQETPEQMQKDISDLNSAQREHIINWMRSN